MDLLHLGVDVDERHLVGSRGQAGVKGQVAGERPQRGIELA
ncbi:hypothetical protein ACFVRD_31765 [Streptomyces sp. NPDC057908]